MEDVDKCIYCGEDATDTETDYCSSCEVEVMQIWEKEKEELEKMYRKNSL